MGLSFFKQEPKIDFVGARFICLGVSALLLLVGLASLALKGGPRYGIDFAGGLMIQAKFEQAPNVEAITKALDPMGLPGLVVQSFGHDDDHEVLIRSGQTELSTDTVKSQIDQALAGLNNPHEVQRVEMVGPKVGADLRNKAMEAMFYAVLLISLYISGRFEQRWWAAGAMAGGLMAAVYVFQQLGIPTSGLTLLLILVAMVLCMYLKLNYALGAVVALVHDVAITIGIFSLLDKEFDLTTIAALLTIIGYSLNDTIIVFDRIRENLKAMQGEPLAAIINRSANQTLSRTILTSGTTLLVVACLYFFGGGVIHDFALALLVGIGVGTYSSIFIAAAILLALK
ncbi:MAG: protein translocase subunit SecF, partial [Desulfovibrio sp.]|nr:protein translocase subunit SecF [Desulfovibrio sp.]